MMHCRLCVLELINEKYVNIFENQEELNWTETIKRYLCIEVKLNDSYSTKLCEGCSKHLQDFVNFSHYVQKRQHFLQDFQMNENLSSTKTTSTNIKLEPHQNEFYIEEVQPQSFLLSEVNEAPDKISQSECNTSDQFILPNFDPQNNNATNSATIVVPKIEASEEEMVIETCSKRKRSELDVNEESTYEKSGHIPYKKSRIKPSARFSERSNDLEEDATTSENTDQLTVEERLNKMEQKIDIVLNNQHKIMGILERLTVDDFSTKVYFPVKSVQELTKIEAAAEMETEKFVQILRHIIQPDGLISNFSKILSDPVLAAYNYDGVNGKSSFKELRSLNETLFEASFHEGYTEKDYVRDIRAAFRQNKKRIFKKEFDIRRKEQNKEQQN